MMRKNTFFYLLVAFSFLFTRCEQTDLTPAFIVIDENALVNCMDVSTFNETHGTVYDQYELEVLKSQRYPALWVSIGNGIKEDNRGVWELPCKIPVLADGLVTVKFTPAYYKNGLSNILPGYWMVEPLEKTVTLVRGSETCFTKEDLIFSYRKNVFFPLHEAFEQSTTFDRREEKGANIVIHNENGRNVGLIELNSSDTYFDIISYEFPLTYRGENYTFLELEYKMEYTASGTPSFLPEFGVGIRCTNAYGYSRDLPLVNFRYSKEWRTVYIDLAKIVGEESRGGTLSDLKICLTGNIAASDKAIYSNIKFFFDNIKITTY